MKTKMICMVALMALSAPAFADEAKTVTTEKKSGRKKKQFMCKDCGKPEKQCECKGEGHGKEEGHDHDEKK